MFLLSSASSCARRAHWLFAVIVLGSAACTFAADQPDMELQAVTGDPFGVVKIQLPMPKDVENTAAFDDFQISEKNGRALYPSYYELANPPDTVAAYVLFRGKEPLDLTVRFGKTYQATVEPKDAPRDHALFAGEWYGAFLRRSSLNSPDESEASPLVDNYLGAMLARRMHQSYNPAVGSWFRGDPIQETLGILLGTESIRMALAKDMLTKPRDTVMPADRPLPAAVAPPPLELPSEGRDVQIEPMARHVPHECFYVRFGSFENFTWFRSTIDEWGGDLRNLTAIRGIDYQNSARIERQLLLKETGLSKIFGPQVIADVAIVGHDTFVREGSSLGLIFQAKNNVILSTSLSQQRLEALKQPGVTEQKVKIADHDVSFISTSDNRVRSFYAVDGDFHLVTNSRNLVQRFFEAGAGKDALSEAHEFRYSRTLMPLSRNDAAFVYLSDEFFRTIIGPKYRVEMMRRMQALTELDLIRVAQLAAKAEGVPGDAIEQLIAGNLLPPHFGERSDGSRPVIDGNGYVDSVRGARGAFLPVADVPIDKVTAAEVEAYQQFSAAYTGTWRRMDPVMIGVQHKAGENNKREQIVLDFHIAPYSRQVWAYSMLQTFLGPPTRTAIAPVPGDIMSVQAADVRIWGSSTAKMSHVFGGLQDYAPEYDVKNHRAEPRGADYGFRKSPSYYGLTPPILLFGIADPDKFDKNGYSHAQWGGDWVRRIGDFALASWSKPVLEEVGPKLHTIEAERPAQVRLHIGDLTQAKVLEFAKAEAYLRADQISHGNTRFLHNLALELKIPPEKCMAVAEELLDGKLSCSLDGKYELRQTESGVSKWVSTRWIPVRDGEKLDLPADYMPPPLSWFRGLDLEFSIDATSISVHAEVSAERK